MTIQNVVTRSWAHFARTRRHATEVCPRALNPLPIRLRRAQQEIEGKDESAQESVGVDVHLRDDEGEENHDDAKAHVRGKIKEALQEVLPPLTDYVVGDNLE
jgi:hypothetical protein